MGFWINKLLNSYTPEPNTGCWLWDKLIKEGYPVLRSPKSKTKNVPKIKRIMAHRFSYEYFKGVIPDGMIICHKCDTPSCINPDHLFLGTHADNVKDMVSKGRNRPGRHTKRDMRFCIRGHEYTKENTMIRTYPDKSSKGRECKTCKNLLNKMKKNRGLL